MKKIDTLMAISESTNEGISQLKKLGISISEDEWTIVQPCSDGNAIITSVVEEFGEQFNPVASKGVVSNWENGYNNPSPKRLKRIAELSDKQLDELALKIRKGIQKDRENEKKQFKKRAFHNTRLLMREYHKLKAHNEVVKEHIEAVQGTFWEHRWLNLDILMQNKARTVKLMRHVDIALDVYKSICLSSDKNEERRKWRVLNKKYIEFPIMSEEKLAEQLDVDRSTISRANKEALEDLSVILFGVDMINEW